MGNVLRVLGIVVASMVLGLVALFLVLFSICGGLESSEGGGVLAVCLLLIVGAVGLIVFLGRGLAASRSATRGLAVAPVGDTGSGDRPRMPTRPRPSRAHRLPRERSRSRPRLTPPTGRWSPLRPLGGTDLQVLIGLRVALGVYILLSVGSMVFSLAELRPPRQQRRDPADPAQHPRRAAAGRGAARREHPQSAGSSGPRRGSRHRHRVDPVPLRLPRLQRAVLVDATQIPDLASLFLRLAAFSALEAGIAGMAIHLRGRAGPLSPAALIVATVAFLFWDGLVQAAVQALLTLML